MSKDKRKIGAVEAPYVKDGVMVKSTAASIAEVEDTPDNFVSIYIKHFNNGVRIVKYCSKVDLQGWYKVKFCRAKHEILGTKEMEHHEADTLMCWHAAEQLVGNKDNTTYDFHLFLRTLSRRDRVKEVLPSYTSVVDYEIDAAHIDAIQKPTIKKDETMKINQPYTIEGVEIHSALVSKDPTGYYSIQNIYTTTNGKKGYVALTAIYADLLNSVSVKYCKREELEKWYHEHAAQLNLHEQSIPYQGGWWDAYIPYCRHTSYVFTGSKEDWTKDLALFFSQILGDAKSIKVEPQEKQEKAVRRGVPIGSPKKAEPNDKIGGKAPKEILEKMFRAGMSLKEALCGDTWESIEIDGRGAFVQLNQYDDESPSIYDLCAYPIGDGGEADYGDFSLGMMSIPEALIRETYEEYAKGGIKKPKSDEVKDGCATTDVLIPRGLYDRLDKIGLIPNGVNVRHVGKSDYSEHLIQPWHIFNDHPDMNYQKCDIIKRMIRSKPGEELLDYQKCQHILDELIRQEVYKDAQK